MIEKKMWSARILFLRDWQRENVVDFLDFLTGYEYRPKKRPKRSFPSPAGGRTQDLKVNSLTLYHC